MMKCDQCVEEGLKSRVYEPGHSFVTAMMPINYYDEEGNYHRHDGNWSTSEWSCSKGHRWSVSSQGRCPQGDFEGGRSVTILDSFDPTENVTTIDLNAPEGTDYVLTNSSSILYIKPPEASR